MATADDRPGGLEERLTKCLEFLIDEGFPESREPVAAVRAAIDTLGECRRAMRGFLDYDSSTAWTNATPKRCGCPRCEAARAALAKLGEGG